jgi:predicted nucleic acid-binding protein
MPKIKVYIDTSVLGAIYDTEDSKRVNITKQLLNLFKKQENFIPFVSNIVIEEVEKAPKDITIGLKKIIKNTSFKILFETDDCVKLVNEYMKKKIIPQKYRDDARHIAVAVVHDMDIIVTWNCRHMANVENKRIINAVNMMLGYKQIDIVTPLEVVGYG